MDEPEPIMLAIRQVFVESEMSLETLGVRMGYLKGTARKSAWQFVNRTNDPRFSMVRRFADAVGVPLAKLVRSVVDVDA